VCRVHRPRLRPGTALPSRSPRPIHRRWIGIAPQRFDCGSTRAPIQTTSSANCAQNVAGTYTLRFSVRDTDWRRLRHTSRDHDHIGQHGACGHTALAGNGHDPVGGSVTVSGTVSAPGDGRGRHASSGAQSRERRSRMRRRAHRSPTRTFNTARTFAARLEVIHRFNALGRANIRIRVQ
jgi:hypothetical protein